MMILIVSQHHEKLSVKPQVSMKKSKFEFAAFICWVNEVHRLLPGLLPT